MSEKVTLNSLAERLAPAFGLTSAEAEVLIKSYFDIIGETLLNGDNVKVKGLGTFKAVGIEARESVDVNTGQRMLIPGHRRAVFTPEKALAERVNAPFAAFEAVELSDEISEADLDEAGKAGNVSVPVAVENKEPNDETETVYEALSDPEPEKDIVSVAVEETASEPKPEQYAESDTEAVQAKDSVEVAEEEDTPKDVTSEEVTETSSSVDEDVQEQTETFHFTNDFEPEYVDNDEYVGQRRNNNFFKGFLIGVVSMLAVLVAFWCWYRFAPENFDNIFGRPNEIPSQDATIVAASPKQIIAKADPTDSEAEKVDNQQETEMTAESADEQELDVEKEASVPTEPSDANKQDNVKSKAPVYDTISKTRFLTTMARDHYGSYHLWPYIYMENSNILGHPDRIKPGTRIVIPPAEKYGINANDKACIAKAKKLGVEIYARYK